MKKIIMMLLCISFLTPSVFCQSDSITTAVDALLRPNAALRAVEFRPLFYKLNNRTKKVEENAQTQINQINAVLPLKANQTDVTAEIQAAKGFNFGAIFYVSKNGNNTTAKMGDPQLAFATPHDALRAAVIKLKNGNIKKATIDISTGEYSFGLTNTNADFKINYASKSSYNTDSISYIDYVVFKNYTATPNSFSLVYNNVDYIFRQGAKLVPASPFNCFLSARADTCAFIFEGSTALECYNLNATNGVQELFFITHDSSSVRFIAPYANFSTAQGNSQNIIQSGIYSFGHLDLGYTNGFGTEQSDTRQLSKLSNVKLSVKRMTQYKNPKFKIEAPSANSAFAYYAFKSKVNLEVSVDEIECMTNAVGLRGDNGGAWGINSPYIDSSNMKFNFGRVVQNLRGTTANTNTAIFNVCQGVKKSDLTFSVKEAISEVPFFVALSFGGVSLVNSRLNINCDNYVKSTANTFPAVSINTISTDSLSYTVISGRYEVQEGSVINLTGAKGRVILDGVFITKSATAPAIVLGAQGVLVTSRTRIITGGGASILGNSANLPVTIQTGATCNTSPSSIQQLGGGLIVSSIFNF